MSMRISSIVAASVAALAILSGDGAWSHENTLNCDPAAAKKPAIERARNDVKEKPKSIGARTDLTDLLVGVGCYDEAVHVLEDGLKLSPDDKTLQSHLRTARSFIGERKYLENLPVSSGTTARAESLRAQLRCKQVGDVQACDQAITASPNDAALWAAKGDALLKEKRSREALLTFNRAKQVSASFPQATDIDLTSRINAAQAMLAAQSPPAIAPVMPTTDAPRKSVSAPTAAVAAAPVRVARTYSNLEPAGRSH
jgi:predicted Zn-dependent protease